MNGRIGRINELKQANLAVYDFDKKVRHISNFLCMGIVMYVKREKGYYDDPIIDSVIMESVRPQKTGWTEYIKNLRLDSLWNLKTESSITGKSFGVFDGHIYLLEMSDRGKYKYLYYTVPEEFQKKNINHKKFIEFKGRLIDPIIYNGMVNP